LFAHEVFNLKSELTMSDPSLLNIPYRFKASKLYSQIPDSGLGDFVVSRSASNAATRVNAQGFIETVANNVPRLDYPLGGIANGCPALLVEPSAQNICLQSADFNTTWTTAAGATVNTNTAISPDGTQNADTINLAAVADSRINQIITVANSTTYTISCFYKNIALTAGQTFNMRFNNFASAPNNLLATATIDLVAGTATFAVGGTAGTGFSGTATGRVENYGNGWYRVSMTFTVGTAGGNAGGFQPAQVGSATARSFYAWGAQFEVGSVATSYIPTTTQAITRGADLVSKTGVSSLIGQTEGTLYWEGSLGQIDKIFFSIGASTTETIRFETRSNGLMEFSVVSGGSSQCTIVTSGAITIGQFYKIAGAYKQNDFIFYVNGVQVGFDNSGTIPTALAQMQFSSSATANLSIQRCRALALHPTRLTNAQLQALTT
jgi:hypothetical protein